MSMFDVEAQSGTSLVWATVNGALFWLFSAFILNKLLRLRLPSSVTIASTFR